MAGAALSQVLTSQLAQALKVQPTTAGAAVLPQAFASSEALQALAAQTNSALAATPNGAAAANFILNATNSNPANFSAAVTSVVNHLGPAAGAVAAEAALINAFLSRRGE